MYKKRKITVFSRKLSEMIPDNPDNNSKVEYDYTIPKFQRHFVWDPKDIKALWDSIYKHYPIGSLIIWESEQKLPDNRQIVDNFEFVRSISQDRTGSFFNYVLDGQQRLTSLIVSSLGGKKTPQNRKNPIDFTIYFSLKAAKKEIEEEDLEKKKDIDLFFTEKEFQKIQKQNPEEKEYFVEVGKLIKPDMDLLLKLRDMDKSIATLYHEVNERLSSNYSLSIISLQNVPIEEVCELFTRVNMRGKKLSTIDLITANTFTDDFYLRDNLEQLYDETTGLGKLNYDDLDETSIIRLISLIRFGACKESDLFKLKSKDLEDNWDKASNSLKEAILFLTNKLGVASPKILPYSPMIVSLAYFFYLLEDNPQSDNIKKAIENWFWTKSFNADYLGATNEEIKNDCNLFKKFLTKASDFNFKLEKDFSDREALLSEKLNLNSGFCRSLLCLMASQKPFDITNHTEIPIYDSFINPKKSELHHIFPKKSNAVINSNKDKVDCVVNICFLPKKSNQIIGNDNPSSYFEKKVKQKNKHYEEDLKSNLIPPYEKNSAIWKDNFDAFIEQRADLIIEKIAELTKPS